MSQTRYRYGYNVAGNILTISLLAVVAGTGDSEDQRTELAKREYDLSAIPDVLVTAGGEEKSVKAYGVQKLLQDRTASMNAGQEEDALKKLDAIDKVFASLSEGKWSEGRESSGEKRAPRSSAMADTLLAKAIAELSGKSELAVLKSLAAKTKDEKKAIAASERVAAVIARLEQEVEAVDLSEFGV